MNYCLLYVSAVDDIYDVFLTLTERKIRKFSGLIYTPAALCNIKISKRNWMNEWMNEWIYSLDRITVSQAGTPRHDNCVRLPVSWKPIINNWLRTIVKTSITNKSYLVIKTYKNLTGMCAKNCLNTSVNLNINLCVLSSNIKNSFAACESETPSVRLGETSVAFIIMF